MRDQRRAVAAERAIGAPEIVHDGRATVVAQGIRRADLQRYARFTTMIECQTMTRDRVDRSVTANALRRARERSTECDVEFRTFRYARLVRRQRREQTRAELRLERNRRETIARNRVAGRLRAQIDERSVDAVERRPRHEPENLHGAKASTIASQTAARTSRKSCRPKYTALVSNTIERSRSGSAHTTVPVNPV